MNEIKANMGLAKVQYPRIVLNHPKYFVLFGLGLLIPILLAIYSKNFWLVFFSMPFAGALFIYAGQLKGLFYDCDVNIGKVISAKDRLYAVAMNLQGNGLPPVLAVKIARGKAPKAGIFTCLDGDYFPVVCHPNYKKSPENMDKVFTIPYTSGTADIEILNFQHKELHQQVDAFEACLEQVHQPYKLGMYFVG